ncbi:MAG TPA: winged helix DNA-binding domain-containing protein [Thermoanaerobaculia bacterium]|nr:winged helix DNA-binding domain-containing protein [Thermoanaerobaculia bacterium]
MTTPIPVPQRRLQSQLLTADELRATPHDVVAYFGAMQAQDYLGALWAVGVRMRKAVDSGVERALAERKIVRCWPMRGTLHFVAAEDVRWMLELLAPRVLTRHWPRLQREFEIDPKTLRRCRARVERALRGGNALTRPELYTLFDEAGIATARSRGLHILFALAHERVIVFGARRGKQPAFVLLDEWLPEAQAKAREEALAALALRYFTSHGPATAADLMWWSGLTMKETKEAISLAGAKLEQEVLDGRPAWHSRTGKRPAAATASVHLLPPYDEYTVAYKDRSAILDPAFAKRVNAGGGIINSIVVVDGRVAGNWKRTLRGDTVEIAVSPFRALTPGELRGVEQEAARYAAFAGREGGAVVLIGK